VPAIWFESGFELVAEPLAWSVDVATFTLTTGILMSRWLKWIRPEFTCGW